MRFALALSLICVSRVVTAVEIPEIESFRIVPQYPEPAAGAALALTAAETKRGRLVVWDGNTVYFQALDTENNPGAELTPSGTGYVGDPSFVGIRSDNEGVILGSGAEGIVYVIGDINRGEDFVAGTEIEVPTHVSGTLLRDHSLLLDRVRDDMVGAEIVIVDLDASPIASRAVVQKPAGSQPAAITHDTFRDRVYVMNPTTRELRYFGTQALIDAYNAETLLNWTDGTPVGAIGQFLNGGVQGFASDGTLLIGGDENAAGTGGIQWVDPDTTPASILDTLDPAGTGPAYVVVYNQKLDQVMGIDPGVNPPDAYASTTMLPVIPPDSPCSDFDDIEGEFTAFVKQYSSGATDLDGDAIPDTAMLGLVNLYACRVNEDDALAFATNTAYDNNGETFAMEANAGALADYSRIIPLLLFMNDAMQSAVLSLLSGGGTPLSGTYATVTCTDIENCLPLFVEDMVVSRGPVVADQPYLASGDPDADGNSNLIEYQNVVEMGGDDDDFVVAAASNELDGTGGVSSGSGGCFIATAAYGTPLAGELGRLRAFRDRALLDSASGAAFVDAYYRLSPYAAAWIAERPAARAAARVLLVPIVKPAAWASVMFLFAVAALLITRSARPAVRTVQKK